MFRAEHEREFHAAVDLVGRSGASDLELGYLHDEVPSEEAGWWASANYKGAKIFVEGHKGPVAAAQALAEKVLDGALCVHCNKQVTLVPPPIPEYCLWEKEGSRWVRGCEEGH